MAITRVDRVERGYLNSGSVTDIANETIENSSAFEQNSQAIMSQVSELYTKITDFETALLKTNRRNRITI